MPCSYQTRGLMLRASIIHLNHELAARTVCACGWRLRDSNALFLRCICGVVDMKYWRILHSSRHTNIQSGVLVVCSSRLEKHDAVEANVILMERCDAPCAGCLSELSSASSSDPTTLSPTAFTSCHISRQCLSNLVVVL